MIREIDFKVQDVSFTELAKVFKDFGFIDQSNNQYFRFFHEKSKTSFLLRYTPNYTSLDQLSLARAALTLLNIGMINDLEVFPVLLEKNRLIAQSLTA